MKEAFQNYLQFCKSKKLWNPIDEKDFAAVHSGKLTIFSKTHPYLKWLRSNKK